MEGSLCLWGVKYPPDEMGVPKVFHLGKLAYFFYYTRIAYLIGILMLFNFNDLRSISLLLCLSFQLGIKFIFRTFLPPFQAPKIHSRLRGLEFFTSSGVDMIQANS